LGKRPQPRLATHGAAEPVWGVSGIFDSSQLADTAFGRPDNDVEITTAEIDYRSIAITDVVAVSRIQAAEATGPS